MMVRAKQLWSARHVLCAAVLCVLPSARAATVFTNYTGVSNGSGYSLFGSDIAGGAATQLALGFTTPSQTFTLTDAGVFVSVFSTYSNAFRLSLYSSVPSAPGLCNGGCPGTQIELLAANAIAPTTTALVTGTSSLHPTLEANTQYWLVLTAGANNTYINAFGGSTSPQRTTYQSAAFGWGNAVARDIQFQINGEPPQVVPEPTTSLMIAVGLASVIVIKRRT
jgi:hypothetical protein